MNPLDLRGQMVRDRWPLRVKNATSPAVTIPPFSVVLITSVAASNNEMLYTVVQPNAASTDFNWNGYLVTGPFAIGSGSTNEGLATDLAQPNYVRYDGSGTPAIKDVWGPKHGQLTLSKNYYGYEVLGGNTTASGNNVTIARWIGITSVFGKIDDTTVNKNSTCTFSVWDQGRSGDTTMNITSVRNSAVNLTSINGKMAQCVRAGSTAELSMVECS